MEVLKKNQKAMLEIKNTVAEMMNVFNGIPPGFSSVEWPETTWVQTQSNRNLRAGIHTLCWQDTAVSVRGHTDTY